MFKSTRVAKTGASSERPAKQRPFVVPWAFIAALILVASLPYLPWITNYFVADDWPILARTRVAWREVPSWFLRGRGNWYRPLFELYMAASARVFGLHPLGYHAMSLLLYVIASTLVGALGWLLTEDRRVAGLAALVFALHSCHSTVVMWIASTNELLAGAFALGSTACYILYRKKKQPLMLFLAAIGCLLAIAAKETALFMPLGLLIYDLVFYSHVTGTRFHWKALVPSTTLLALVGVNALLHPPGPAYPITLSVGRLARNALLYLSMQTLTTSHAYGQVSITPLSLITERLAALGLFLTVLVLLLTRKEWNDERKRLPSPSFFFAMVFISLFPAIFVITERTAFLSSAFVSLALSYLFVQAWVQATKRRSGLQVLVIVAVVLWMIANTVTLVRRNYWWGQAGAASRTVMEQLDEYVGELPGDAQVWLLNLPDHLENAYAFRRAFPHAVQLLGYDREIHAVLDVDLAHLSLEESAELERRLQDSPDVVVLCYDSRLTRTASIKDCLHNPSASHIVSSRARTGAR